MMSYRMEPRTRKGMDFYHSPEIFLKNIEKNCWIQD